jgi:hypothetical protein
MHANGRHTATLNMEYVDKWAEGERYSHYVFILFISHMYTEIRLNLLVGIYCLPHILEVKAVPLQAWGGPEGSRKLTH